MIREADRLHHVQEYYFSTKLREVRAMVAQGHPVINMGIGSPDLAPAPEVLQMLQEATSHAGAHQYQSYQGLPELRKFGPRHACLQQNISPKFTCANACFVISKST